MKRLIIILGLLVSIQVHAADVLTCTSSKVPDKPLPKETPPPDNFDKARGWYQKLHDKIFVKSDTEPKDKTLVMPFGGIKPFPSMLDNHYYTIKYEDGQYVQYSGLVLSLKYDQKNKQVLSLVSNTDDVLVLSHTFSFQNSNNTLDTFITTYTIEKKPHTVREVTTVNGDLSSSFSGTCTSGPDTTP